MADTLAVDYQPQVGFAHAELPGGFGYCERGIALAFGSVSRNHESRNIGLSGLMQEKKWTNLDFSSRTDALAAKIGIDIGELPDVIGFSRASLFAYRGGKASITSKAWRKLEQAEREAGLAPAFEEQFKAASGKEVTQLLESATRKELFSVMPPEVRKLLMEGDLEKINNRMIGLFINTDGLMTTAKDYLAKPRSKEARSELEFFVKKIAEDLWPARKLWDEVYKSIRARLLEE